MLTCARAPQKRKGGPLNKDVARALKQTKITLAERDLDMAPDAITAPRAYVRTPTGALQRRARVAPVRCALTRGTCDLGDCSGAQAASQMRATTRLRSGVRPPARRLRPRARQTASASAPSPRAWRPSTSTCAGGWGLSRRSPQKARGSDAQHTGTSHSADARARTHPTPHAGESFFQEGLSRWRELNTAEHFASFSSEVHALCATLPLLVLHQRAVVAALLARLVPEAALSLDALCSLAGLLARDLRADFLPHAPDLIAAFAALLAAGADREPEAMVRRLRGRVQSP